MIWITFFENIYKILDAAYHYHLYTTNKGSKKVAILYSQPQYTGCFQRVMREKEIQVLYYTYKQKHGSRVIDRELSAEL